MKKSRSLIFISILFLSMVAKTEVFPVHSGNVDVIYTENTYADLAAKTWMIGQAKRSIDISAFIFAHDQYGLTIVDALRRAMDRGVDVRIMYESSVARMLGEDLTLKITDLLVDPSLKKPARVINMLINEKRNSRLAVNDYIHQKLIMVDTTTPNEMIYFGGRDLGEFSRITVDSGYIIRRVHPNRYYVGDDIRFNYSGLWQVLSANFNLATTTADDALRARIGLTNLKPIENEYLDDDKRAVNQVLSLLSRPPRDNDELAYNQFRPATSQLITNDILLRLIVDNQDKSLFVRPDLYSKDDIANKIIEMTKKSQNIEIASYSSHFVPTIHNAFREHVANGKSMRIYTNGYEAMASMDAVGISAVSFDYTIRAMRALEWEARKVHGRDGFEVYGLDRETTLNKSLGVRSYLHRKLILFDNEYVMSGSYNFTESSSSKNDEMMVLFKDARMNEHHRALNHAEKKDIYLKLNLTDKGVFQKAKDALKRLILGGVVKSQY